MRERIRQAQQNEGGFTLIELLIVITVLGVLAGIVVFGVATFREDATAQACKTDAKSVEIAAQAYMAKTGAYPATIAVLVTDKYLKATPTSAVVLGANGTVSGC
jgi:general secretion pathway protein G